MPTVKVFNTKPCEILAGNRLIVVFCLYVDAHLRTTFPNPVELDTIGVVGKQAQQLGFHDLMLFELLSARIHHLEVMIEVNVFRYPIVNDTDFIQKILRKHIRLRLRNDLLDGVFDRLKSVINPHVLFVNLEFGNRFERLCRFFPRPVRQSVTDIRIKIFQNEIDRRETLLPVDNFVYLISFMKGNQRADIIVLLF